jgi:hypothetical protein
MGGEHSLSASFHERRPSRRRETSAHRPRGRWRWLISLLNAAKKTASAPSGNVENLGLLRLAQFNKRANIRQSPAYRSLMTVSKMACPCGCAITFSIHYHQITAIFGSIGHMDGADLS